MRRITLAFILFSSVCQAQDYYRAPISHQPRHSYTIKDTSKRIAGFISLDIGISVPTREYASRSTINNFMIIGPDSTHGKGFANVGFHGNVSGGIYITPSFGVIVKIGYNDNSFDETTLNALINGNYTYTVNNDYSIWEFMGGIFANVPVSKKSSVWFQGMAGLVNASFPTFTIYNLPNAPQLSWNFSLANANNLGYSISTSFETPISLNASFIATVSYTATELSYPSLTFNYTGPYYNLPPPYTQHVPVTMSFGSLDFTVGLLFHF